MFYRILTKFVSFVILDWDTWLISPGVSDWPCGGQRDDVLAAHLIVLKTYSTPQLVCSFVLSGNDPRIELFKDAVSFKSFITRVDRYVIVGFRLGPSVVESIEELSKVPVEVFCF